MVASSALLAELAAQAQTRRHGRSAEPVLAGPQGPRVRLADGREVINLCSNDYLGLANDPRVRQVAEESLARSGFGLAAGRIICGTTVDHQQLEAEVSAFLGTDATVLFNSCFDANSGIFQALLGPDDVVISDGLNHASIIDGIRLCRAARFTYASDDLDGLNKVLADNRSARRRLIVTDGVFSMDGQPADLARLCDLAEEHDALLVVDDSHATGVLGDGGRGTISDPAVAGRIDLVTGTFGKALGGAAGGFASGRAELVDVLRLMARPYVFSNALPPAVVAVARHALRLLGEDPSRQERLRHNTRFLRAELAARKLRVPDGAHPIIPVIIGDEDAARAVAAGLLNRGVLAVALSYPVVPRDTARIRLQVSAAHAEPDLAFAAAAIQDVLAGPRR